MDLDSLIRVYSKGSALELCATLQCTGKDTPLSIHMRLATAVLALGVGRAQDDCLDKLALIGTHTGPKGETGCVAALGLARVKGSFCFYDVGVCSTEGEGVAESDVFLGDDTSYGGSKSTEKDTVVDHSGDIEDWRIARSVIEARGQERRSWKGKCLDEQKQERGIPRYRLFCTMSSVAGPEMSITTKHPILAVSRALYRASYNLKHVAWRGERTSLVGRRSKCLVHQSKVAIPVSAIVWQDSISYYPSI